MKVRFGMYGAFAALKFKASITALKLTWVSGSLASALAAGALVAADILVSGFLFLPERKVVQAHFIIVTRDFIS